TAEDECEGGNEERPQASPRCMDRGLEPIHASAFGLLGEFNDQNGVLCSQSDQNDQPDVDQDISIETSHVRADHRGQNAHWNDENHSERQNPALVESGEQQEYKSDREAKGYDRSISRKLLLQRDLGPLECKTARQAFFGNSLSRGDTLTGRKATRQIQLDLGGWKQII